MKLKVYVYQMTWLREGEKKAQNGGRYLFFVFCVFLEEDICKAYIQKSTCVENV